ncbi:MAG: hypothetical protein EOM03_03970 [Clostridia bacterium]|nr:hypothetical protein [Clostridia bacterium]
MDKLGEALNIMLVGMMGIFLALGLIYVLILLLNKLFPEIKRVKRVISRKTGEVLSERDMKPGEE